MRFAVEIWKNRRSQDFIVDAETPAQAAKKAVAMVGGEALRVVPSDWAMARAIDLTRTQDR